MGVEFEDNRIRVEGRMSDEIVSFLYEAAGTIKSQTQRNSRVATSDTKGSWTYEVDESKMIATVGSPLENAIWEEFGTGEYALEGKGRKGGWWIKVGNAPDQMPSSVAEKYGWEQVRRNKKGEITAVFTSGKKPNRALQKAYDSKKNAVKNQLANVLKGLNN